MDFSNCCISSLPVWSNPLKFKFILQLQKLDTLVINMLCHIQGHGFKCSPCPDMILGVMQKYEEPKKKKKKTVFKIFSGENTLKSLYLYKDPG